MSMPAHVDGYCTCRHVRPDWDRSEHWTREDVDLLVVRHASLRGWASADLTTGLRDAYRHGLAVAVPTGPRVLGWAMVAARQEDDR